jgi:hypothetical protein
MLHKDTVNTAAQTVSLKELIICLAYNKLV